MTVEIFIKCGMVALWYLQTLKDSCYSNDLALLHGVDPFYLLCQVFSIYRPRWLHMC